MGIFLGTIVSVILFVIVFVVGLLACASLIIKGVKRIFSCDEDRSGTSR